MLSFEELKKEIESAAIDTVIVAFTDMPVSYTHLTLPTTERV